ncbi:MAG: PAS domain-containing protein [Oscillochloris sp.]|nr:PAS domain-containing protein [Oscillochloris sp.]
MPDSHHDLHALRAANADLERRIAALEADVRAKEAADVLLRASEAREAHIKQVLLAIRNVNQMMMQVSDPRQLITQACACLTETLGYFSAWIALLDADGHAVRMLASAGLADGLADVGRRLERGEFPELMRRALAQAAMVAAPAAPGAWPDDLHTGAPAARRELACRLAFRGRTYGVLVVSVLARYADDEEDRALFKELVGDISFALRKIEDDAAFRETSRMLGALMNNIPGMVYQCANDANWTMRFVSAGVLALTGYDHADIVLHRRVTYASLIHPDDCEQVWSVIQVALAAREAFEIEYRIRMADGQEKWVWERGHGVYDPDGRLLHLEGFITDITERTQAEEKIRQTENFYRALIEHAPDGVVLIQGERFTYVSPSSKRMFGYDLDAPLDGTPQEMTHPDDLPRVLAEIYALIDDPFSVPTIQYRFLHRDGSWIWIESTFSNLLAVPGVESIVINFRDISERKQAEAALDAERASLAERVDARTLDLRIANAELARAARLKDEFLANMSHELRTPLNDILGRAELLRETIYGPVTPRQAEALRSIDASGRHLLALITDILDLSKIEAGKLSLQVASVDVDLVCQISLHMVAQSAIQKQITVGLACDKRVTAILADELRLKQILINLLTNAVKFTPAGGQIGLEVVGDVVQQTATFSVWDTGIGIAPEDRERLFRPFSQIDSGLNRQYNGTGLGLSLVQRLTEAHGGSVGLVSAPGQGSRFSVTLPWHPAVIAALLRPPSAAHEPPPSLAPPQTPPTWPGRESPRPLILLADDNKANSAIIEEYLRAHGYAVLVAQDGAEALAQTAVARPALVLMDVQMPGMDGLDAIRHIRASPEVAAVPIIVLTALAMSGDRERCLEAGADAYLAKPVSLQILLGTIAGLLPAG